MSKEKLKKIFSISKKYVGRGVELELLFQAGIVAYLKSNDLSYIEKYIAENWSILRELSKVKILLKL
jgi:hypothetical protein